MIYQGFPLKNRKFVVFLRMKCLFFNNKKINQYNKKTNKMQTISFNLLRFKNTDRK